MTEQTNETDRVRVFHGDSREVLRTFPDSHFDSVVTDPPYALVSIGKRLGKADAKPIQHGSDGAYARAARGFMGKTWDTGETAFDADFWREVLRVLKPGGHIVAFGGSRTYGELQVSIAAAGFEVRDSILEVIGTDGAIADFLNSLDDEQLRAFAKTFEDSRFGGLLAWVYGSGFPKSHNVAKGMAKRRVEDLAPIRTVCRFLREVMDAKGLKSRDLTRHFGDCNARLIDHWAARDTDSQPSLPTPEQWDTLVEVLQLAGQDAFEFYDGEVARLNARKGTHGERWAEAEVIGEVASTPAGFGAVRFEGDRTLRRLDEDAAEWEGWGTALKPAFEPIVLARKPLIGSVVDNVLAHRTGALNIDACRIATDDVIGSVDNQNLTGGAYASGRGADRDRETTYEQDEGGRFPANLITDGSAQVVDAFPKDVGAAAPAKGTEPSAVTAGIYGDFAGRVPGSYFGDKGSAARFFYSSKADGEDRVSRCPVCSARWIGKRPCACKDPETGKLAKPVGHPTVKPVDVKAWLARLITPPGGVVLDCFAGSGTTGMACLREGFRAVLIEREAEYVGDIMHRLRHVAGDDAPLFGGRP